jgi:hypothetical protein
MIGRDFVKDSTTPGRAILQFDNYFTWLEGNTATILRPSQTPLSGHYDFAKGELELTDIKPTETQVEQAMAHVIAPSLMYREQRYRLTK